VNSITIDTTIFVYTIHPLIRTQQDAPHPPKVAVYCENHTEHINTVRTSQKTHYVSATKTNRLMLFKETVPVYFENHTEHTNTVRTSQETHYVSATKPNRLMLFMETFAVCCEKHMKHINTIHGRNSALADVTYSCHCVIKRLDKP
jgi:hypothetical protein